MKYSNKDWFVSALQGLFGKIALGLFTIIGLVVSFFLGRDCSNNNTIQTTQESSIQTTVRLNTGDRVISQNTTDDRGKKGIRIRCTPKINPYNHEGWLFDGATGKIIDGPIYDDHHVWWKVAWDPGLDTSKIKCDNNDSCTGWTAETVNNALILKKM